MKGMCESFRARVSSACDGSSVDSRGPVVYQDYSHCGTWRNHSTPKEVLAMRASSYNGIVKVIKSHKTACHCMNADLLYMAEVYLRGNEEDPKSTPRLPLRTFAIMSSLKLQHGRHPCTFIVVELEPTSEEMLCDELPSDALEGVVLNHKRLPYEAHDGDSETHTLPSHFSRACNGPLCVYDVDARLAYLIVGVVADSGQRYAYAVRLSLMAHTWPHEANTTVSPTLDMYSLIGLDL